MFKTFLKFIALFILFVSVAGAASFVTLTYIVGNEESVVVPDLVGRDVITVLETLSTMELNTKVKGTEYSSKIPRNRVIFQDPAPGTRMKRGRHVRIVFSKGPKAMPMPHLKHLPIAEAKIKLMETGLEPGITSSLSHPTIEKGAVITHVPASGTRVARGMKVDLLISTGKPQRGMAMRNLSGLGLDEAIQTIESMGLTVGAIASEHSFRTTSNTVLGQSPLPGFRVTKGQSVDITINRTPSPADKPTQTGVTGSRLFTWRMDKGFLKKRIKVQLVGDRHTDTVLNRDALPGEELWVLIPTFQRTTLFLYEDGALKETRFYN